MSESLHERVLIIRSFKDAMADLHPIFHDAFKCNREWMRASRSSGKLPNFAQGDYVLVAREDSTSGEKQSLRWRGLQRFLRAVRDIVLGVEYLSNGQVQ